MRLLARRFVLLGSGDEHKVRALTRLAALGENLYVKHEFCKKAPRLERGLMQARELLP